MRVEDRTMVGRGSFAQCQQWTVLSLLPLFLFPASGCISWETAAAATLLAYLISLLFSPSLCLEHPFRSISPVYLVLNSVLSIFSSLFFCQGLLHLYLPIPLILVLCLQKDSFTLCNFLSTWCRHNCWMVLMTANVSW